MGFKNYLNKHLPEKLWDVIDYLKDYFTFKLNIISQPYKLPVFSQEEDKKRLEGIVKKIVQSYAYKNINLQFGGFITKKRAAELKEEALKIYFL